MRAARRQADLRHTGSVIGVDSVDLSVRGEHEVLYRLVRRERRLEHGLGEPDRVVTLDRHARSRNEGDVKAIRLDGQPDAPDRPLPGRLGRQNRGEDLDERDLRRRRRTRDELRVAA